MDDHIMESYTITNVLLYKIAHELGSIAQWWEIGA